MRKNAADTPKNGRRLDDRLHTEIPVSLICKTAEGERVTFEASAVSTAAAGFSFHTSSPIPARLKFVNAEFRLSDGTFQFAGRVSWLEPSNGTCGVKLDRSDGRWAAFLSRLSGAAGMAASSRRKVQRRGAGNGPVSGDRRNGGRRFEDFLPDILENEADVESAKVKTFLRSKSTHHSPDVVAERRAWLEGLTGARLHHIAQFSEPLDQFRGKIENPIGVSHIPLGVAGPLKINGGHAQGTFFVPLATTEGALVTSYTLGSHIVTRSGGANVKLLKDELRIGPIFVFRDIPEANRFLSWVEANFVRLKEITEKTSRHLRLEGFWPIQDGRRVILNFRYHTGDAMGMNMACRATEEGCRMLTDVVAPEEFWLRSNFNANKKVTANNFINGYGKMVTADVVIPRRLITMLNTTPEDMERYFFRTLLADAHAVQIGGNGHFANGIAALYIACGQDVALVANAHVGISTCEVNREGDLYFSAYLSNVLSGTVGGGTGFGTARECLQLIGCEGTGKARKFAEVVAATALAGEIGICASVVNNTYVLAHETFGRNRPSE